MIAAAFATRTGARIDGCTYDPFGVDGNVYAQHMPETPDTAVMWRLVDGDPELSRLPTDSPNLQCIVRGEPGDPLGGYDLARAIYDEFHCLDDVTLGGEPGGELVTLIGCTARQSEPVAMGPDDRDRAEWSLNFAARVHRPTRHRA